VTYEDIEDDNSFIPAVGHGRESKEEWAHVRLTVNPRESAREAPLPMQLQICRSCDTIWRYAQLPRKLQAAIRPSTKEVSDVF
jgi:hypothetical protein